MRALRLSITSAILTALCIAAANHHLLLPNKQDSVRFAVIGDNGTGDDREYETAGQLIEWYDLMPFSFVIMMGDNMYGGEKPKDFIKKFEQPYRRLLDAGVKFH